MFIERLTKEQINKFFGRQIDSYISKNSYDDEHLYVSYDTGNVVMNHRLYDFEGSTLPSEESWRRYLYNIFGNEYYEAYESYLESQKEMKLKSLLNNTDKGDTSS